MNTLRLDIQSNLDVSSEFAEHIKQLTLMLEDKQNLNMDDADKESKALIQSVLNLVQKIQRNNTKAACMISELSQ